MEKQDILSLAAAMAIVAILALVVKPALSGEDILGVSLPSGREAEATPVPARSAPLPTPRPTTPAPAPSPTAAWNGAPKSIGFVDPAVYQIQSGDSGPRLSTPPAQPQDHSLVTYAVIQGRWSGTTEILRIPFPYWEMHYTAEPLVDVSEDHVTVFPRINIQVMDADDPNRFVRVANPDILDSRLFAENDPRPWIEKFYEGNRNYYFVINARFVSSYTIEIKVPKRYVA
ncbi:MAG: hypothetical protein QMD46_07930 [Methanomicrobiales archaeon]|nr:hypothetical protein [Methanomicrobiales archaeon]MDI6877338.1 hypothetical protein [Methanomicrobiales archaeon]